MNNCGQPAVAGRHNCKQCRRGASTCWIHQFTPTTVRTQFIRQMVDVFTPEERRRLHLIAERAMLPFVAGQDPLPLDQAPIAVLNRELDAAAALLKYRRRETKS